MIMLHIHFQLLVGCSIFKNIVSPRGKILLAGVFKTLML